MYGSKFSLTFEILNWFKGNLIKKNLVNFLMSIRNADMSFCLLSELEYITEFWSTFSLHVWIFLVMFVVIACCWFCFQAMAHSVGTTSSAWASSNLC